MPKVIVNNISIHYKTMGQGPNIVMIHGIASNLAFWYLKIFPILARDFSVAAYDLRGHGYSGMPESGYTSADMANDLNALLDKLGIENTHLVGHSFGGLIALHYAALYPERVLKLAVADTRVPALDTSRTDRPVWDVWRDTLRSLGVPVQDDKNDIDYLIQQTEKLHAGNDQTSRPGLLIVNLKRIADLAKNTSLLNDFRAIAGLTVEKIRNLSHPILVTCGENSAAIDTCRSLSENLPNCKSVIIPNAGHFHPLEQSDIFLQNLREFLG